MARLVPELPRHVAIVGPRLAFGFMQDARHHFRHIDFANPLVKHHQHLRIRRHFLIVKEGLRIDSHIVGIREPLVASGRAIEDKSRRAVMPNRRFCILRHFPRAIQSPGTGEANIEKREPVGGFLQARVTTEGRHGLRAPCTHIFHIHQCLTANTARRVVSQGMRLRDVALKPLAKRRQGFAIETGQAFLGRWRRQDFVKKHIQRGMLALLQAQRGLAHFTDSGAEERVHFRREMGVIAERHLDFIHRLLRNVGDANLVDAPESVMEALEPLDAGLDGQAGLLGFVKCGDADQGRKFEIRGIGGSRRGFHR